MPVAVLGRLATLVVGAVAVLLLAVAAAPALGVRATVLTGASMAPTYPAGATLAVRPVDVEQVAVGDVVTFRRPGQGLTTHRVVALEVGDGAVRLVTRGDANPRPDPVPVAPGELVGRVAADVSAVSTLLRALPRGRTALLALGVVALAVALREAAVVVAELRRRHPAPRHPTPRRARRAADRAAGRRGGATSAARARRSRRAWARALSVLLVAGAALGTAGPVHARFVATAPVPVAAVATSALTTPTGLVATPGCALPLFTHVELAWAPDPLAGSGAVQYEVVRDGEVRATVSGTTYDDPASPATTHTYTVRAVLGSWSSATSAPVAVTTALLCVL